MRAQFDASQKIELLEFVTSNHEEYVPRTRMVEAARPLHEWQKEWQKANTPADGKQSPEMSKKKRPMKSPPTAPPEIDIPESKVKGTMGITPSVFRFLEVSKANLYSLREFRLTVPTDCRSPWSDEPTFQLLAPTRESHAIQCIGPICSKYRHGTSRARHATIRPADTKYRSLPHGPVTISCPSWSPRKRHWGQSSTRTHASTRDGTATEPARNQFEWSKCKHKSECLQ